MGLLSVSIWGKVCCLHVIPSIGLSAGWNCPYCERISSLPQSQGCREDLIPSAFILSLQRDPFPATLTAPAEPVFCVPPGPIGTQKSCVALPGSSQELLEEAQDERHHPGACAVLVQPWRHLLCLFQMRLLPGLFRFLRGGNGAFLCY